ncbi:CHAT domain-containing protein [Desulfococcaceae bacterium HSG7]|nr:CHAT domain-containing protein [Desulfococcaceae bacterium HSG7]
MKKKFAAKTYLVLLCLITVLSVLWITNAYAEIAPQEFLNRFFEAFQKNDSGKIIELIKQNQTTAKNVQKILETKGRENSENGIFMAKIAEVLGNWMSAANSKNKDPDEAKITFLHQAGSNAYDAYKYDKAFMLWKQGLAISRKTSNLQWSGSFLTNIGMLHVKLYKYERAMTYLKQALAIHKEINDQRGKGAILSTLGAVYAYVGQYDHALTYLEQALAIRREIDDQQGEGVDLSNIGLVYGEQCHYDKALAYYEQAMAINEAISNKRGESDNLSKIGSVYIKLGQYSRALTYLENALAIHRAISNRHGESAELNNIGIVYGKLGQYDKARTYFDKTLSIKKSIDDRRGEGAVLTNIGAWYKHLGQNDRALNYYKQAMAIYKKIRDQRGKSAVLTSIGGVYYNVAQDNKALTYYKRAMAIKKQIGDQRGEASDLTNIGVIYNEFSQYYKALTYYEHALDIFKEIGDQNGESASLSNIGGVYTDLGQYDKARSFFDYSLAIGKKVGALESLWKIQRGLARTEVKTAIYALAIQHYKQALDTIELMRSSISTKEFQTSFMQGKLYVYDELIALLQSLHQKHPDKGYDRQSLEIFERKQGRILLEEMGKSGTRNYAGIPDEIISQENELNNQIDKRQSDLVNERAKPQKKIDLKRIRRLEAQIEVLQTEEKQLLERIKKNYPGYYALKYPRPVPLKKIQTEVLQPGEMMLVYGVMKKKTCLWVIGKDHFSLHTIDAGTKKLKEKVAQYRRLVISLNDAPVNFKGYQNNKKGNMRGIAGDFKQDHTEAEILNLYALLFPEPVQKLLKVEKKPDNDRIHIGTGCAHRSKAKQPQNSTPSLYIIPTGPLYLLPFEALQITSSKKKDKPRYLIEDHAVAYLSSASLLKIIRDSQARQKHQPLYPLLAYANPVYQQASTEKPNKNEEDRSRSFSELRAQTLRTIAGGRFWRPLLETADEVQKIKKILKAPDKSHPLYLEEKATRRNVFAMNKAKKLDDYRYLVFSCHGVLPDEVNQISQSALVLSHPDPVTQEDGFLTMADVFGLQLNADLVSLSACNTGRGKAIKGEGVIGLTRAFMYAGTPAVAVTLWSVESMSAKDLNVGMFKHLSTGKSRAEALRAIKLSMIRGEQGDKWRKPEFWAPMVIFGDAR